MLGDCCCRGLLAMMLACLVLPVGSAYPQGNVEDELSVTRRKLKEETGHVDKGEARADSLMTEIRSLDKRLLASGRNQKALRSEEQRLETEYAERNARFNQLEAEREEARAKLGRRLADIYKRGRLGSSQALAQAATSTEPLRMARYLAAVSKADASVFDDYDRISKEHRVELRLLDEKRKELAAKKQALKLEASRYEAARVDKTDLLASVERDLAEHRVAAERLAAVEARLQQILAPDPDAEPRPGGKRRTRSRLARMFRSDDKPFADLKGELTVPVAGRVVRRFGDRDADGPGAKGLVVRADGARQVVAVAGGEVVFAGPFPGLGKTLIINHGDRYHSVYAHLGTIRPEVGQRVDASETIGALARVEPELHFELRVEGRALDPQSWFDRGYAAFQP